MPASTAGRLGARTPEARQGRPLAPAAMSRDHLEWIQHVGPEIGDIRFHLSVVSGSVPEIATASVKGGRNLERRSSRIPLPLHAGYRLVSFAALPWPAACGMI